jgi:hypothetical protein
MSMIGERSAGDGGETSLPDKGSRAKEAKRTTAVSFVMGSPALTWKSS